MFYYISKTIDVLAMPINIAFFALLIGFFLKNRRKGKRLMWFGFLWLYIFSSPITVNWMLMAWEIPPVQPRDITKKYEFGVVLTGGMNKIYDQQSQHVWTGRTFDRVSQAFQLYKAGKIKKILISGGEGLFRGSKINDEALGSKAFLIKAGVNPDDIILEQGSLNTRQNAQFAAEILHKNGVNECLVITSSYHMRRSLACFRKVGVNALAVPAAFLQNRSAFWFDKVFPNEEALFYGFCVWHEIVGFVTYKIAGYI